MLAQVTVSVTQRSVHSLVRCLIISEVASWSDSDSYRYVIFRKSSSSSSWIRPGLICSVFLKSMFVPPFQLWAPYAYVPILERGPHRKRHVKPFYAIICDLEDLITKPFRNNKPLHCAPLWLHYSNFQASCHVYVHVVLRRPYLLAPLFLLSGIRGDIQTARWCYKPTLIFFRIRKIG
jgi:hypothetical protein